jgi:hypothetical protein
VESALSSPSSGRSMATNPAGSGRRSAGLAPRDGGHAPHSRWVRWARAGVEKHSFVVKDHKFIEPLRCDECGGNAHLIRRSPHPVPSLEIRVFECHECGHQTKRVVKA